MRLSSHGRWGALGWIRSGFEPHFPSPIATDFPGASGLPLNKPKPAVFVAACIAPRGAARPDYVRDKGNRGGGKGVRQGLQYASNKGGLPPVDTQRTWTTDD